MVLYQKYFLTHFENDQKIFFLIVLKKIYLSRCTWKYCHIKILNFGQSTEWARLNFFLKAVPCHFRQLKWLLSIASFILKYQLINKIIYKLLSCLNFLFKKKFRPFFKISSKFSFVIIIWAVLSDIGRLQKMTCLFGSTF